MLTIIKPIDKIPTLIEFSSTSLGKVVNGLVFSYALFLFNFTLWPVLSLCLLAISFSNRFRIELIIFFSLYYLYFLGGATLHSSYKIHIDLISLYTHSASIKILNTKTIEIIALTSHFLVTFLMIKLFSIHHIVKRFRFSIYLGLIVLTWILKDHIFEFSDILNFYLMLLLFYSTKFFWFTQYVIRQKNLNTSLTKTDALGLLFPFWAFSSPSLTPIPRGPNEYRSGFSKNKEEFAILQLKAIKLIFWCLILRFISTTMYELVFDIPKTGFLTQHLPSLSLANLGKISFYEYNQLYLPFWQKWISALTISLRFILFDLASGAGLVIAIARMTGIHLFRQTYKPYLATNFNDFFKRIFFYYNEILMQFFFYPCWKLTQRFNLSKKTRIFIVTFMSVFLGAFMIHLLRDSQLIGHSTFYDAIEQNLKRSPYYFLLGLFTSLSTLFRHSRLSSNQVSKLTHTIRLFLIIVAYTICFTSQLRYNADTPKERLRYNLSLVGINI